MIILVIISTQTSGLQPGRDSKANGTRLVVTAEEMRPKGTRVNWHENNLMAFLFDFQSS